MQYKRIILILMMSLLVCLIITPAAFAKADLEVDLDKIYYKNGKLYADGTFYNPGSNIIYNVAELGIKIYVPDDKGNDKQIAVRIFTDINMELLPSQKMKHTFDFGAVPQYNLSNWDYEVLNFVIEY